MPTKLSQLMSRMDALYEFDREPVAPDQLKTGWQFASLMAGEHVAGTEFVIGAFFVLHGAGWQYGEMLAASDPRYLQATTACLMAIVLAQMVNLFVCRHPRLPAWHFPLLANRWLLAGLASEVILLLAIIYTPWGNRLFGTAPLPLAVFLYALPFALFLGLAEEVRKWFIRRQAAGKVPVSGTKTMHGV